LKKKRQNPRGSAISKPTTRPRLDELDRRLLAELQDNARVSSAELARRFDLSGPGLQKRLRRLEE